MRGSWPFFFVLSVTVSRSPRGEVGVGVAPFWDANWIRGVRHRVGNRVCTTHFAQAQRIHSVYERDMLSIPANWMLCFGIISLVQIFFCTRKVNFHHSRVYSTASCSCKPV